MQAHMKIRCGNEKSRMTVAAVYCTCGYTHASTYENKMWQKEGVLWTLMTPRGLSRAIEIPYNPYITPHKYLF
jgi:hypothetical protein